MEAMRGVLEDMFLPTARELLWCLAGKHESEFDEKEAMATWQPSRPI